MRESGPNDGLILAADGGYRGGTTAVEVGLDHFLADGRNDARTVALLRTVVALLAASPGGADS